MATTRRKLKDADGRLDTAFAQALAQVALPRGRFVPEPYPVRDHLRGLRPAREKAASKRRWAAPRGCFATIAICHGITA